MEIETFKKAQSLMTSIDILNKIASNMCNSKSVNIDIDIESDKTTVRPNGSSDDKFQLPNEVRIKILSVINDYISNIKDDNVKEFESL